MIEFDNANTNKENNMNSIDEGISQDQCCMRHIVSTTIFITTYYKHKKNTYYIRL